MLLVNHPAQCHYCADRPTMLAQLPDFAAEFTYPASSPPPPPGSTAGPACHILNMYYKLVTQCNVTNVQLWLATVHWCK